MPELLAEAAPGTRRRRHRCRGAARLRAGARLRLRGGDRRLLPAPRLRGHRAGDRRRVRERDRDRLGAPARLQVRPPGAPGPRRRPRQVRGDRASRAPRTTASSRSRASVNGEVLGRGSGRSKKAAEQAAAEQALDSSASRQKAVRPAREASRERHLSPMHLSSIIDQGLQVLPRAHQARLLAWRQRDRRAERLRQVERHRRGPLGARRAEPAERPRPVDAGHDLRGRRGRRAEPRTPRSRSCSRPTVTRPTPGPLARSSDPTRRLERGGEGSYRINGARARLADVIEILSDANLGREMHSVISQGRVEEIVLSAPRDRRLLVEEAAGLGKHRKRRRRAQLKLERTQDNLDRALDVEREARKSLRPLKRQAEAADIHARLEREAAELRARLLASELHGHDDELAGAERAATSAREARARARREARRGRRAPRGDRGAARGTRERAHRGLGPADRGPRRSRADQRPRRGARRPPRRADPRGSTAAARRSARWPRSSPTATGASAGDDPVAAGIERIGESLGAAIDALDEARGAGDDGDRAAGARCGPRGRRARGADGPPGRGHARQPRPGLALGAARARGGRWSPRSGSSARPPPTRATPPASAPQRSSARMLGESGEDAVTDQLRACSREEAELQTQLRAAARP